MCRGQPNGTEDFDLISVPILSAISNTSGKLPVTFAMISIQ